MPLCIKSRKRASWGSTVIANARKLNKLAIYANLICSCWTLGVF
ncbi:hypothetical protein T4A_2685 [Trichinella pseudospiralis]|uniref:Uncharacterized protein n=1 Tax=Trichinella pseudospiralis TaxID=6337 RepID=A0A0V1DPI0_TRIPS|nr:hypothetical protein T4A_2685 [Trichinella pseudospiralis]